MVIRVVQVEFLCEEVCSLVYRSGGASLLAWCLEHPVSSAPAPSLDALLATLRLPLLQEAVDSLPGRGRGCFQARDQGRGVSDRFLAFVARCWPFLIFWYESVGCYLQLQRRLLYLLNCKQTTIVNGTFTYSLFRVRSESRIISVPVPYSVKCEAFSLEKGVSIGTVPGSSVVDPNRLYSYPDPDPGSHVHSDPDPALDPNRIRINSDPDPTYIVMKMPFLIMKFSFQLILRSI